MFIKMQRATEDGWSRFLGVAEVHTARFAYDTFAEHANAIFDHDFYDMRENIRWPPAEEIERIDAHESMQHGFVVITATFTDGRKPLKLYTNARTYLCQDNGQTSQKLM